MPNRIKTLVPPKPISKDYIVEMLRGLVELAFKERILYIEINVKTDKDKKLQSFTFGDATHLRE